MGANYRSFEVQGRLSQSDSISTVQFNIALEKIIEIGKLTKIGTLFNKSHQVTAFADNERIGLENSEKKTKFIHLKHDGKDNKKVYVT